MTKPVQKKISLGIAAGVSTGIFWGLPFLVPQMLPQFSSLEISFGRFFFFGIMSLFFIKNVFKVIQALSWKDRGMLLLLSASGFWFYSTLLFWGVQKTDGVISSLILGLLPISIPLFTPGRESGGKRFYLGLMSLLLGLIILFGFPIFSGSKAVQMHSPFGVFILLSCLGLWTWFAISNSRFLKRNQHISRMDFASVMGVVSLISILPFFIAQENLAEFFVRDGFLSYGLLSMALGVGSSWLANWLWNICSFHCPSELSGPLIVSETIFGLLYSFMFEKRVPFSHEMVAIFLFMLGVFLAVTAQMKVHVMKKS